MGFVSFNHEAEQYFCAAVLRPGNVTAAVGAVGTLRRLIALLRHFLPGVRIRVRLDGGFAHPAVLDLLEAEPKLEYLVAMAKNAVLKRKAKPAMRRAASSRGRAARRNMSTMRLVMQPRPGQSNAASCSCRGAAAPLLLSEHRILAIDTHDERSPRVPLLFMVRIRNKNSHR